jgi:hypothetical protein
MQAVLHAITREYPHVAVVHADREVTRELALDLTQHFAQLRLEVEDFGRFVELVLRCAPFVRLAFYGLDGRDRHTICPLRAHDG